VTNFELNDKAQQLADTSSAYELARRMIEMEQERDQLRGCFYNACGELAALKAALVDEGDEAPIGPALSLVEALKGERDALAAYAEDLRKAGNRAICYGGAESPDEWHRVLAQAPEVSLALRDAGERAKGASAIRHLTQGEGWEDQDLRKVIDDYIATVVQVSQATKEALDGD